MGWVLFSCRKLCYMTDLWSGRIFLLGFIISVMLHIFKYYVWIQDSKVSSPKLQSQQAWCYLIFWFFDSSQESVDLFTLAKLCPYRQLQATDSQHLNICFLKCIKISNKEDRLGTRIVPLTSVGVASIPN